MELEAKFWSNVDFDPHDSARCWPWKAATQRGYGSFQFRDIHGARVKVAAHRQAYIFSEGEIEPYAVNRVELDHSCHDPNVCQLGDECPHRGCCNPHHMQLSTSKENGSPDRMVYWQRHKTHCPSGHPYDVANTQYRKNGHRICGACNRLRANRNRRTK